ncbi:MAG: hypothetical protein IM525_07825 [Microcystis sp. M43BS1]|nr:hypothetical protein [Microcystis sp. M43BS1]MCA2556679.1 hypothetical protein [Microcystis sp. M43BS1]
MKFCKEGCGEWGVGKWGSGEVGKWGRGEVRKWGSGVWGVGCGEFSQ